MITATDIGSVKFTDCYAEGCPVYAAFDEHDIFAKLEFITKMSEEEKMDYKKQAATWVEKTIDWKNCNG